MAFNQDIYVVFSRVQNIFFVTQDKFHDPEQPLWEKSNSSVNKTGGHYVCLADHCNAMGQHMHFKGGSSLNTSFPQKLTKYVQILIK